MALKKEQMLAEFERKTIRTIALGEPLIHGLNNDQRAAFFKLRNFIMSPEDSIFVLKGYAGTGKTFLVQRLVEFIRKIDPYGQIALTAPTNKAVRVLMRGTKLQAKNVAYITVHSLLGLKETIDAEGNITFTRDNRNKNTIIDISYLIIDELSMLDDKLYNDIYNYHRETVRIIMMGDPAQIPPVGASDCIPFRKDAKNAYKIREATLKEIMRQTHGNPIIEASFGVRENISSKNLPVLQTKLNKDQQGVVVLDAKDPMIKPKMQELLKEYFDCDSFKADPDYAKVIAWRNTTVGYFNTMIRAILYGEDAAQIVNGEKLIVSKPILIKDRAMLNTSEELVVNSVFPTDKSAYVVDGHMSFKVYRCNVEYASNSGNIARVQIDILREESRKDYDAACEKLKQRAKTAKLSEAWVRYYEFIRLFADVAYNYAITAHKAQGSTYSNVFLIEKDIDVNPKIVERNRIKYTAYSRPTQKLFILK